MIVPNTAFDLCWHVVIITTGLAKTSGTIYCYIRRKSDGYWYKTDGTWSATVLTGADLPTATHLSQGIWKLNLAAAVTNVLTEGEILQGLVTDNETAASATVTSDFVEEVVHHIPLAPTTAGRTLDVSSTGEAGVDWANVGTPGSTVALSATTVGAVTGLTPGNLDVAVSTRLAPTTPGNTLDVNATGEAGVDWANVGGKTTTVALTNTTINPTSVENAVWDAVAASHVGPNTVGKALTDINTTSALLQKYETGRWKMHAVGPDANRLVIYDVDGTTPLLKFDLKDVNGAASYHNVFERVPV